MVPVTLVDSNVWIFLNIEGAPERKAARERIEDLSGQGLQVNDIIVSEVFHKLSKLASLGEAKKRVEKILASQFVVYEPLRLEVVRTALSMAVQNRMRINDAIIAAQAVNLRTAPLTDNVRDFRQIGRTATDHASWIKAKKPGSQVLSPAVGQSLSG